MAIKKSSKNNPTARVNTKGKMVVSSECEKCNDQCPKGKRYLQLFQQKKMGKGVFCESGGSK
jgi:hypothetical protein